MLNEIEMRKSLRNTMRTARESLSSEMVSEYSSRIVTKLCSFSEIVQSENIMCFLSIGNEIDLRPLVNQLQKDGKQVLLPRVAGKGIMSAVIYEHDKTRKGPFGITEPEGEAFDPKKIDVVILPGLVYDYQGYRLGYGGGYYDRFLTLLRPGAFICGVCYDFQIVETVFPHAKDVAVDWIVTEKSELVVNWAHF